VSAATLRHVAVMRLRPSSPVFITQAHPLNIDIVVAFFYNVPGWGHHKPPSATNEGRKMKKTLLLCLSAMILITACSSAATSTPTPEYGLPPLPTPTIDYQVVGSTKNTYMVVVDPQSSTDRTGLQAICDYLCKEHAICRIWFWDDINKADTSYPVDPDKEGSLIAAYTLNLFQAENKLVVYTLGDE
jgi:hypothetical protein